MNVNFFAGRIINARNKHDLPYQIWILLDDSCVQYVKWDVQGKRSYSPTWECLPILVCIVVCVGPFCESASNACHPYIGAEHGCRGEAVRAVPDSLMTARVPHRCRAAPLIDALIIGRSHCSASSRAESRYHLKDMHEGPWNSERRANNIQSSGRSVNWGNLVGTTDVGTKCLQPILQSK